MAESGCARQHQGRFRAGRPSTKDETSMGQKIFKKKAKFSSVQLDGKDFYQLDDPFIRLNWKDDETTEIEFDYPGKGVMLIPLPGLFTPIDGSSQIFRLKKNKTLVLELRSREEVENLGYKTNGSLRFSIAIFDENFKTFAIANSPPDMILGP